MKWIGEKLWNPINIVIFGLFCVVLPIAVWKNLVTLDPALRILGVIVSWPMAVAIVLLAFFDRFQGGIDHFLHNVRSVQFPGGNVQVQAPGAGSVEAERVILTPQQRDEMMNYIAKLETSHSTTTATLEQVQQQLQTVNTLAFEWKFRFLNVFYVPATKQVLLWFAQYSPQTRESFHQAWQPVIADLNQRAIILDVLLQYGMVATDGTSIRITPEGYGFLQFIGLVPYAPPQPQRQ